jgi:acyl carrier protein
VNLREKLLDFIGEDLLAGEFELGEQDNLLEDGMIDSLSVVRLVVFIEDEIDQVVQPADITLENFGSVDQLATFLESQSQDATG